jgi:hypothetical protein
MGILVFVIEGVGSGIISKDVAEHHQEYHKPSSPNKTNEYLFRQVSVSEKD